MFCGPGKQIGPAGDPIKVWCLGDSLTAGAAPDPVTLAYVGSYRCPLYQAMLAQGLDPDFVGTVTNVSQGVACAGTAHSGYTGASPANWNSSYFATYSAAVTNPDLVIVLLGANGANDDTTANHIFGVVNQALALWPRCSVAVMTMYRTQAPDTDWAALNAGLRSRAAKNPRVILVEQSGAITPQDLWDGLHLTRTGYRKLADGVINAVLQRIAA